MATKPLTGKVPKRKLSFPLSFPGTVGDRTYELGDVGWYRLLLTFTSKQPPRSVGLTKPWSGAVRSRPAWIQLRSR